MVNFGKEEKCGKKHRVKNVPVRKVYGLEMIDHVTFLTETASTEGAQEALRVVAVS